MKAPQYIPADYDVIPVRQITAELDSLNRQLRQYPVQSGSVAITISPVQGDCANPPRYDLSWSAKIGGAVFDLHE